MPVLPVGVLRDAEIAEAVHEVERVMAPDVVRIRYELDTDWSGDWAVYFRVVMTDEAADRRLRDTAKKVASLLDERLNFPELGLSRYHNVRSESEQTVLREAAWA